MARYLTNFDDEYFGKQYKAGDELKGLPDDADEQLKGAVTDGRLTVIERGDPAVPALGATNTADAPHPLDHDGDGRKGGSKAGDEATAKKKA